MKDDYLMWPLQLNTFAEYYEKIHLVFVVLMLCFQFFTNFKNLFYLSDASRNRLFKAGRLPEMRNGAG